MSSVSLASREELHVSTRSFRLEHGGSLPGFGVRYSRIGRPDDPVVLVQGGISATPRVTSDGDAAAPTGWWESIVGPGRAIDTNRNQVISLEYLDGVVDSEEHLVSSLDQARLTRDLLDALGIEHVHGFVGCSYGGMVALRFAAAFGARLGRLVVISAPARSHPTATAWRVLQRRILELGERAGLPSEGIAIARGLGLVSYRSPEEFESRFPGPAVVDDGSARFAVGDYLEARGADFAERFSTRTYRALSRAIDLHRVDPRAIETPSLIVGSRTDQLVPVAQVEELAAAIGGYSRCVILDSPYGHDAFLKETDALTPHLRRALGRSRS